MLDSDMGEGFSGLPLQSSPPRKRGPSGCKEQLGSRFRGNDERQVSRYPSPMARGDAPTPMMAQYKRLKDEAGDALLFYRMGDFFELFFDDARIAAVCLDIALTKRGDGVPMCGVPCHSAESYLARLIRAGHRVAIAEQTESPAEARKARGSKALVDRAIVRLTPEADSEDAADFLQGLLTNDVKGALPAYAALLSAQGKTMFDVIVWPGAPGELLLDCEAAVEDFLGNARSQDGQKCDRQRGGDRAALAVADAERRKANQAKQKSTKAHDGKPESPGERFSQLIEPQLDRGQGPPLPADDDPEQEGGERKDCNFANDNCAIALRIVGQQSAGGHDEG